MNLPLRILPPGLALAALLAGLVPGVLTTGQVDPLDWLLPCGAALLVILLLSARAGAQGPTGWRLVWSCALVGGPPLLLCAMIGTPTPGLGLVLLGGALLLILGLMAFAARRGSGRRGIVAAAMALGLLALPSLVDRPMVTASIGRPVVGVMSALPLGGGTGLERGVDALRSVGLRSPLWQALDARLDLHALDALDAGQLARFNALLLAQPRRLAPAELVALDAWVRDGGHVVILADPLLRWPDPRPLAHPRRAPITSLLDPLLRHWGLRLEPAPDAARGGVERRRLSDGALLQLAGASRFTVASSAPCRAMGEGLLARCRIGGGTATLVADADWINDDLWTLAPEAPLAQRRWTSDAVPVLARLLNPAPLPPTQSWVRDERSVLAGLRWALILLLAVGLGPMLRRALPGHSQRHPARKRDQMENMGGHGPNSG